MFFCFLTNFLFQILWVLRLTYKTYMEQKCTLKTGMLWNYDRIKSVQNNWQDDVHIFQFWSIYNVLNNFVCIFDFKIFTSLKLKQAAFDLHHSRKRLISRMSHESAETISPSLSQHLAAMQTSKMQALYAGQGIEPGPWHRHGTKTIDAKKWIFFKYRINVTSLIFCFRKRAFFQEFFDPKWVVLDL
jgi:hypothetical protein